MNEKFNTSSLEIALRNAVVGQNVSKNVYFNRPRSKQADLEDFVVCMVSGGVGSQRAFGRTTFTISLFARDLANMKNEKKLGVMEKNLLKDFPMEIGNALIDGDEIYVLGDTPDGNGYHARVIQVNKVIIKIA